MSEVTDINSAHRHWSTAKQLEVTLTLEALERENKALKSMIGAMRVTLQSFLPVLEALPLNEAASFRKTLDHILELTKCD